MSNTYCLATTQSPFKYNLAKVFNKKGMTARSCVEKTQFNDHHLELDSKGCEYLEFKHLLSNVIQKYCGSIMPETITLDDYNFMDELNALLEHPAAHQQWILKPALQNNGENIHLFTSISAVWDHYLSHHRLGGPHVLQRYIDNPDLLDGAKYSLRVYVIITTYAGSYLYPHGYLNKSLVSYDAKASNLAAHLTNEHLGGALSNVKQIPTSNYPPFESLRSNIMDYISQTLYGVKRMSPSLFKKRDIPAFDIFGYDFMLDANKKLWLLEVNHRPHFPTELPHELNKVLFDNLWEGIVDNFALPIIKNTESNYKIDKTVFFRIPTISWWRHFFRA